MERIKIMCMVHGGSRVAIGYGTGYHHVKVNAEKRNKSPMPVVIDKRQGERTHPPYVGLFQ